MSWYIGVDPSSTRVGVAALHEDGDLDTAEQLVGHITYQEFSIGSNDPGRRFVYLREAIRQWIAPYADLGVMCAVIEDPKTHRAGSTVRASLGVAHEAVCSILPNTSVHVLESSRVKLYALGNGHGGKPGLMAGARLLGYRGASQDIADAICCADAARVIARRNTRSAA